MIDMPTSTRLWSSFQNRSVGDAPAAMYPSVGAAVRRAPPPCPARRSETMSIRLRRRDRAAELRHRQDRTLHRQPQRERTADADAAGHDDVAAVFAQNLAAHRQ